MDLKSIFHDAKVSVQVMKSADNETLTGVGVDMAGYEGVAFIVSALKGEVAAFSIKAQQDTDSAYGTAADLLGTATAFSDAVGTDAVCVLDIYQPRERYVRPVVTVPDWTAKPVSVIAIQYGAREVPVSNAGEFHQSPAEGTA